MNIKSQPVLLPQPKFLWFITLSYTMVIIFANWFDARLIRIFNLNTDAGTLIFPLTFLLSDLITEVYGYKYARIAIWCGFLFNVLFILYGQLIIHMPSPHYQTNNAIFDQLLTMNIRIIIASAISYFSSEPLNSLVIAKLKIKMKGKHMGLRFVLSTFLASGTDSFIFGCVAFYSVLNSENLISLILTMWFIKVMIELIALPISIRLAKNLKRTEGLDIYDNNTNFNFLTLEAHYKPDDNRFKL